MRGEYWAKDGMRARDRMRSSTPEPGSWDAWEHGWEVEIAIWAASAALTQAVACVRFRGYSMSKCFPFAEFGQLPLPGFLSNGMSKCFPFADYEAQGGGEAFTAETFFMGDFFDGIVVAAFEVDDALEVFGGH